ncbi:MAG: hypothetical protein IT350_12565 [Deltaproteobacteria bacterium]|nr:hypothetical protein [Deltaproteobacteria bacterium]
MSERYTLRQGVDGYLARLAEMGASEATRSTYARCLQIAVDHFGEDRDLRRMIAAHVAGFFKSDPVTKKPDGSPRAGLSIAQIKRAFRQALAHAHECGKIDAVPLPRDERG